MTVETSSFSATKVSGHDDVKARLSAALGDSLARAISSRLTSALAPRSMRALVARAACGVSETLRSPSPQFLGAVVVRRTPAVRLEQAPNGYGVAGRSS